MKKKIILLFVFLFILIPNTLAITINVDDTVSLGSDMDSCQAYSGFYACYFNNNDMGYRFTVIDKNNKIVSGTKSVDYFSNGYNDTLEDLGVSSGIIYFDNNQYKVITKFSQYMTGYRYGSSNVYSTQIERIALGSTQKTRGSIGILGLDKMLNRLKEGGSLFKTILKNAGVTPETFAKQNYSLLIEPIYVIGYNDVANQAKFKFVLGTATNISKFLLDNYKSSSKKLDGLTVGFLPNLACNVCEANTCGNTCPIPSISANGGYGNYAQRYVKKIDNLNKILDTSKGYGMTKLSASDIDIPLTGTLKIVKTNNLGKKVTGAKFTIYQGHNCPTGKEQESNVATNSNGQIVRNLNSGNYSIKETWNSNYYIKPDGSCINVTIETGKTNTKNFTNTLACQYYKDEIVGTDGKATTDIEKQNLMNLYQGVYSTSQGDYSNYNGLLNFSNPQCQTVSCPNYYGEDNCMYATNERCTNANCSANQNFSITSNNVSCYNDTVKYNNKTYYCETYYAINDAYTKTGGGWKYNSFTSSGQFFLVSKNEFKPSISLRLWKACYIPGITNPGTNASVNGVKNAFNSNFDISKYFSNIKLYNSDDEKEYNLELVDKDGNKVENSTTIKFNSPKDINNVHPHPYMATISNDIWYKNRGAGVYLFGAHAYYKLPTIYLEKGTGKVFETKCDNCIFGGSGIITKFTYKGNEKFDFVYEFNTNLAGQKQYLTITHQKNQIKNKKINISGATSSSTFGTCEFTATQEIIKTTPSIPDSLQLVFRAVDTDNPFLKKTSNGIRNANTNWCSNGDCKADNCVVKNVMNNRNDSSLKKGSTPLYRITLTPADIKTIRAYNKKTSYDDYTLECDSNGNNCKSRFLDGLKSGTLTFYNVSTKRRTTIGSISNRLTINNKYSSTQPTWLLNYDENLCQ